MFQNAVQSLSEDDQELPQVIAILPMLKRGIGIHHGGLLPILKEVIEILFQEGLIKCLFATETFSIGINMPARTVVFTSTRKFDGKDFRWVTSGEYIQMSGRAGRRGKDTSGIVIQMIDEKMEPDVCKGMIYGASDPLFSSYHLCYNMVLNMLRVEDANPEHILHCSFHQYQQEKQAPILEQQANELVREASLIQIEKESEVAEYHTLSKRCDGLLDECLKFIRQPQYYLSFMQSGRLLYVRYGGVTWGWGVLVQTKKMRPPGSLGEAPESAIGLPPGKSAMHLLDMLLVVNLIEDGEKELAPDIPFKPADLKVGEMQPIRVVIDAVERFSAIRLKLPQDLNKESVRKGVLKSLNEIMAKYSESSGGPPLLDPITDMGITEPGFKETWANYNTANKELRRIPLLSTDQGLHRYNLYLKKLELLEKADLLRKQASESQAVAMKDDLRRMKRVLRRLAYVSDKGVLELKGRFCCEVTSTDHSAYEIVLTDMVFDGVFNDLSPEQAVALLSCFVHKESSKDASPKVRPDLEQAFKRLKDTARVVAKCSIDAKLPIDEEEFVKALNPAMMEVAFAWAAGAKFIDICRLTDIFEGNIIRSLRRLEELLRQLATASLAIGNMELKNKFEGGADKIRRGVVFAASLYI